MPLALATARFRRQHAELGAHATAIVAGIQDPSHIARDAHELRRLLAVLAGKLKVHAAMEDEALYPRLLDHPNVALRDLARRFRIEFGGVYATFLAFVETWDAAAIEAQPTKFADAARATMQALGARVQHENDELYEAVDTADIADVRSLASR